VAIASRKSESHRYLGGICDRCCRLQFCDRGGGVHRAAQQEHIEQRSSGRPSLQLTTDGSLRTSPPPLTFPRISDASEPQVVAFAGAGFHGDAVATDRDDHEVAGIGEQPRTGLQLNPRGLRCHEATGVSRASRRLRSTFSRPAQIRCHTKRVPRLSAELEEFSQQALRLAAFEEGHCVRGAPLGWRAVAVEPQEIVPMDRFEPGARSRMTSPSACSLHG
jgi:hypothetical protein